SKRDWSSDVCSSDLEKGHFSVSGYLCGIKLTVLGKLVALGIQLEPEGRRIITVSGDFHHKHIIAHVGEGLHGFRLEVHQLFKFTIGIQVVRGNGSGISLSKIGRASW